MSLSITSNAIAMKSPIYKPHEVLKDPLRLLTLGVFYLGNPPIYKFYG